MRRCSCCARCCVVAVLVRTLAVACVLAVLLAALVTYELVLKPWGEEQIANASPNGGSCASCAGVNAAFPVAVGSRYSELQVLLINRGGDVVSGIALAGAAVGAATFLFSLASLLIGSSSDTSITNTTSAAPSSASPSSSDNGRFEALLVVTHGQFVTLLGSLNLHGAPLFFFEFCKKFAWTNLQIFPRGTPSSRSRVLLSAVAAGGDPSTASGVQRYAQHIGVEPDHLFYYTCFTIAIACATIAMVYLILRCCSRQCKSDSEALVDRLDTRVVWATILLLLVLQYALAMTSSFHLYDSVTTHKSTGGAVLAASVFLGMCLGFIVFGVMKASQNKHELADVGTDEHESKPMDSKYGVYYDDFTVKNRYFFVAKLGLEVLSGAVVGAVQDPAIQIGILVALNAVFLLLVILRDPFLVHLFYYVGILSGYVRIVLLLLVVVQTSPDTFPQSVRDLAAELVIGLNALLFMCLLARQMPETRFTLQELIAAKIRDDPPLSARTPPTHGGTPTQPYHPSDHPSDHPSHRFV